MPLPARLESVEQLEDVLTTPSPALVADLARVAAGGAPQRNPDHATALRALAPTVAPVALFRYHRSLLAQRALVAHPLVPRLVAETILIRYRELFR